MKRFLCMLIILAAVFSCATLAEKEDPVLELTTKAQETSITAPELGQGDDEFFRVFLVGNAGRTDLWIDGTEVDYLQAENEVYRLRISTYKPDGGQEIAINKTFVNHHDYYNSMVWKDVLIASESGMYGPYLVEILNNDLIVEEIVYFKVDASGYEGEPGKGILLEGTKDQLDFVETCAPFTLHEPSDRIFAMWGGSGNYLQCIAEFDHDYESLTLSLTDTETGKVLAVHETGPVHQFAMLDLPVESAFRSGAEYELKITAGDDIQTRRFRLMDEALADSAEPLSVAIVREDGSSADIETFRQGDCCVIDPSDPVEGTVSFNVQGGNGLYRLKLTRAGEETAAFSVNWHADDVRYGQLLLNNLSDEVFRMQISSGGQKIEYDVKFVMPDPPASPWMQQAPWDGNDRFVVSTANNIPVDIISPAEGCTMHGRPGYLFPVSIKVTKADDPFTISLIDRATGETISTVEQKFDAPGTYAFDLEFPSDYVFDDGTEFIIEAAQGDRSLSHVFRMHLEQCF